MVMIVTMEEIRKKISLMISFIDMQVTLEGNVEILFEFDDFEEVIQIAKSLATSDFQEEPSIIITVTIIF